MSCFKKSRLVLHLFGIFRWPRSKSIKVLLTDLTLIICGCQFPCFEGKKCTAASCECWFGHDTIVCASCIPICPMVFYLRLILCTKIILFSLKGGFLLVIRQTFTFWFLFLSVSFYATFRLKVENIHGSQCFMLWLFGVTLKLMPASICPIQRKSMCMSNILGASKQTFILACGTVTWSMFSTWQINLECEPCINSKAWWLVNCVNTQYFSSN